MYYWSVSPRTYLYSATVADRSLVDENLLFIRRWAAATKIKMIMAAVAVVFKGSKAAFVFLKLQLHK